MPISPKFYSFNKLQIRKLSVKHTAKYLILKDYDHEVKITIMNVNRIEYPDRLIDILYSLHANEIYLKHLNCEVNTDNMQVTLSVNGLRNNIVFESIGIRMELDNTISITIKDIVSDFEMDILEDIIKHKSVVENNILNILENFILKKGGVIHNIKHIFDTYYINYDYDKFVEDTNNSLKDMNFSELVNHAACVPHVKDCETNTNHYLMNRHLSILHIHLNINKILLEREITNHLKHLLIVEPYDLDILEYTNNYSSVLNIYKRKDNIYVKKADTFMGIEAEGNRGTSFLNIVINSCNKESEFKNINHDYRITIHMLN